MPERSGASSRASQPAYITGRRWDVLAWNEAAEELFAFGRLPEEDRNIFLWVMTQPAIELFGAAGDEARRMVAQFRRRTTSGPTIRPSSSCWTGCGPAAPSSPDGGRRTTFVAPRPAASAAHPKKAWGFEYASFQANDDPALKLAIYTPSRRTLPLAARRRSGAPPV